MPITAKTNQAFALINRLLLSQDANTQIFICNVNGEQFCRFIKSNSLFAGIKVLLCSAENEGELKRIVRDAGADGYVTKDSLIARVILDELEKR